MKTEDARYFNAESMSQDFVLIKNKIATFKAKTNNEKMSDADFREFCKTLF